MGLDIHISVDNRDDVFVDEFYKDEAHLKKYSLSRTFCNFMCRENVVDGVPELDQIAKITSVDISPVYGMNSALSDETGEALEFMLSMTSSEEERNRILQADKEAKEKAKGNIDKVINAIDQLIEKLSSINNLPDCLDNYGYDTLDSKNYFSDFNLNKGDGYIGNNFGQDLRNFKSFLDYAKSKGSATVYFVYG